MPALALVAAGLQAQSLPSFDAISVGGQTMHLPRGWSRQQDDASMVLTKDPADSASPVLALFAVQADPAQAPAPAALADAVLGQLNLAAQGLQPLLLEQRSEDGALYRLHRLDGPAQDGYLSSYTHVNRSSGALVHMLYSARDFEFVALGGPALPLVVFAGVDPAALHALAHAPVASRCDDSWACAENLTADELALASRISQMSHESSMKLIYNLDSGWCYRGESDCE